MCCRSVSVNNGNRCHSRNRSFAALRPADIRYHDAVCSSDDIAAGAPRAAADVLALCDELSRRRGPRDAHPLRPARIRPELRQAAVDDALDLGGRRCAVRDHRRADELARCPHRFTGQAALSCAHTRFVRHSALPRRLCLGAARGAECRACQSVVLRALRPEAVRGSAAYQHLLGRRHGLRHGAVYVSVRVHIRRQQPRGHSQ